MRAIFLCIFLTTAAFAETSTWSGSSTIAFDGTSTINSWGGKVDAKPFTAKVVTDASGKPEHLTAKVVVEVSKMDTNEPKRDVSMRSSMQADDYPLISALIDTPFSAVRNGNENPAALPMQLTLLGKPHTVLAKISKWKLNGGNASFEIDFSLSLKDCGIKVPSMLLVIRVADTIKIHGLVALKRNPS